jgi:PleD family two-component response regulator
MGDSNLQININRSQQVNYINQFKILVVDDDNFIAESLGEILSDRGHIVTIANESMTCIGKCQKTDYDIIFMDFHLTDYDGANTTDLLKNVCNNKSIVFGFTGDDSKTTMSEFMKMGVDGAIIKPIDIDLIEKLMIILETKQEFDKHLLKNILKDKRRQLFIFD